MYPIVSVYSVIIGFVHFYGSCLKSQWKFVQALGLNCANGKQNRFLET